MLLFVFVLLFVPLEFDMCTRGMEKIFLARDYMKRQKPRKPRGHAQRRRLLPVMRPSQNMREIIKQLTLLEDHLCQPEKRCKDCINKHFLTTEALAEEAVSLSNTSNPQPPEAGSVARSMRVMHHAWAQKPANCALLKTIAAQLRTLRKCLMKRYATLPVHKLPSREVDGIRRLVTQTPKRKRRHLSTILSASKRSTRKHNSG